MFFLLPAATAAGYLGAYFANWAQYHPAPYKHVASDVAPIAGRLDEIMYSFVYFCPPAGTNPMPYWAQPPFGNCNDATEYSLMFVETLDPQFAATLAGYKASNPKLKFILSIGGWNFPSAYFSKMVSSSINRAKFINSAVQWLAQYNADGIDLDWEFPCSPARTNPVEITCDFFRYVEDAGGNCPADSTGFVDLVREMRAAFGPNKLITVASQAADEHADQMLIKEASQYVDRWHIMTYDYTVSDIPDGAIMSPNCPLYSPQAPALKMSINDTVFHYLNSGVPASKIEVGIAYYGHTWYAPQMTDWTKFGQKGQIQGACCGLFKNTYGAKYGKGSNQCGLYMYSEIQAAQPNTYYDQATQSTIGYFANAGADGWTEKGTWVTYNDLRSVRAIATWAKNLKLGGVFIFDTSMDSISGGRFTFELTNAIADVLATP